MTSRLASTLGALISFSVAAFHPAGAAAQAEPGTFDFAAREADGWSLTATTNLAWYDAGEGKRLPKVASIQCSGEGPQFRFGMDGTGALTYLRITFLGLARADGERDEITLLGDHLWLYVDGSRWEYANIKLRSALANVSYPIQTGEIILTWRGHQAVREHGVGPWFSSSMLYERLITAKKLAWSYKSRNWQQVDRTVSENQLPIGWETTRYPIDGAGLSDAVSWCATQVASDTAYTLPTELKQSVSK